MSTTNVAPVHPATGQTGSPAPTYVNAIGYLRAFIVVMVVAHHAALAYYPYAPPVAASLVTVPRWWQAFPVVDPHQWGGAPLFVGFNDTFFMSLMFILSGLFVWSSLRRKGGAAFLRDRLLRLGLPFLIMLASFANGFRWEHGRRVPDGSCGCCFRSIASRPCCSRWPPSGARLSAVEWPALPAVRPLPALY